MLPDEDCLLEGSARSGASHSFQGNGLLATGFLGRVTWLLQVSALSAAVVGAASFGAADSGLGAAQSGLGAAYSGFGAGSVDALAVDLGGVSSKSITVPEAYKALGP